MKKLKIYISTIFAWSFLSFALLKLFQVTISNVSFVSLIVVMSLYFLYLFYLWIRLKSIPSYLEYMIITFVYALFITGFAFVYNMVFKMNEGNYFSLLGYFAFAILITTLISGSILYWLTRLIIKIL
jgi:hypothetical protein